MNRAIPLTESIHWVGANDRETELFENLWPLPHGVSYNAYLIEDQKTALVDAVKGPFLSEFLDRVRERLHGGRRLDYLIINHMEPDHSGSLRYLLHLFPDLILVGNAKTMDLLKGFYNITDRTHVIQDGDGLDLGSRRLEFAFTPMVHWPETMMTFDSRDRVLFSGDAFGGFGATDLGLFDDEIDQVFFEDEILRYFSNIVGRYSPMVLKAIDKVSRWDIGIVASTHGPIWRRDPHRVIDLYARWSRHETDPSVVLAYASMYGNTYRQVEHLARALTEAKVPLKIHNLSRSHASFVIRDIWRARGLVLACPTYNMGLFPLTDNLVRMLENKQLKNRFLALLGSYGWAGGAMKTLTQFAEKSHWQLIDPVVEAKCAPAAADFENCRRLAAAITARLGI